MVGFGPLRVCGGSASGVCVRAYLPVSVSPFPHTPLLDVCARQKIRSASHRLQRERLSPSEYPTHLPGRTRSQSGERDSARERVSERESRTTPLAVPQPIRFPQTDQDGAVKAEVCEPSFRSFQLRHVVA